MIPAAVEMLMALVQGLVDNLPMLLDGALQLILGLAEGLLAAIPVLVEALPAIITGIVGAVGEGVVQMAEAGANLVRGLWQGIQSLAGWLWDQVSDWIGGIWDGITGFFGIASPSKEMAWVGSMLVEGLAGSIRTDGRKATDAATSLAANTLDAFSELVDGVEVPIDATANLTMPTVALTPAAAVNAAMSAQAARDQTVDVEGTVDTTARRLLGSLDIQVVLNDGTLVGIAPAMNTRLARLSRRDLVLTGGA